MMFKLLKDSLWVYLTQVISLFIPLLTLAHLTSVLTLEQYGEYAFSLSIVSLLIVLQNLGVSQYGIESESKKNNTIDYIYNEVTVFKLSNFLLLIGGLSFLFPNSLFYPLIFVALSNCFSTDWVYQCKFRAKEYAIIIFMFNVLLFISILFCINDQKDLKVLIWLHALQSVALHAITYLRVSVTLNIGIASVYSIARLWRHGKEHLGVGLLSAVKSHCGVFLYGIIVGPSNVGVIAIIERFISFSNSFSIVINRVVYPYFLKIEYQSLIKYIKRILTFLLFASVLTFIAKDDIVMFIDYHIISVSNSKMLMVEISIFMIIFNVASQFIGYPYLGVKGRVDLIYKTTFISLLLYGLSILINILLHGFNDFSFLIIWAFIFVLEFLLRFCYFIYYER